LENALTELVRQVLDKKASAFAEQVDAYAVSIGVDPVDFRKTLRPFLQEAFDKHFPA